MRTSPTALSPTKIFGRVLLIVFVAEFIVMFILPMVVSPTVSEVVRAAVDSALLTVIIAPILWQVIIRPLRHTAVAERTRADSIIEAAADGIVTTNEYGKIESFNAAAEQIFGCHTRDVIGQHASMLISLSESDENQHGRLAMQYFHEFPKETNRTGHELEGRRKNGSAFPMWLAVSEIYFSGKRVYTAIVRDLTEQKRAELQQRERDIARAEQMAVVAQLATGSRMNYETRLHPSSCSCRATARNSRHAEHRPRIWISSSRRLCEWSGRCRLSLSLPGPQNLFISDSIWRN